MRKASSDGGQQASSIRWVMGLIPKETLATLYILSLNITQPRARMRVVY